MGGGERGALAGWGVGWGGGSTRYTVLLLMLHTQCTPGALMHVYNIIMICVFIHVYGLFVFASIQLQF